MSEKLLEYVPYTSVVNPSFWSKVAQIKLDIDRLQENYRHIWGSFTNLYSNSYRSPLLDVDSTSFNPERPQNSGLLYFKGAIVNKNTIEDFKDCDKLEILRNEGLKIWENIKSGVAIDNPSLLNTFFLLSFADLKKYHFYYWFAFPSVLKLNVNVKSIQRITDNDSFNMAEIINKLCLDYFDLDDQQRHFFLIRKSDFQVQTLKALISTQSLNTNLSNHEDYYFCFSDPCMSDEYCGWPLRNYILFLFHFCPSLHGKDITLISFRLNRKESKVSCTNSLLVKVTFPINKSLEDIVNDKCSWTGWERNERGNLGPRLANMRDSLDPKGLAQSSAELNLKLMKWSLVPDLDLDKIHKSKCLIIGAGTLGCAVARALLGWGVKSITFIDGSKVNFSNPVRQCLYTYEDSLLHLPKCEAAVKRLQEIFPGVETTGHHLSIPMPGHPVGESLLKQTEETVEKITNLIKENDIIFTLMDSRESRWLPTVLSCFYEKIVVNAALGFDSYLIMRHGQRGFAKSTSSNFSEEPQGRGLKRIPGEELGCYFCNDVTAPGDSLRNRTLDQQCTVTRPGVSMIAGALAVELAISILQHKDGARAAAYYTTEKAEIFASEIPDESLLGILPHSIRGFLSSFCQVLPATRRYKQCIACSDNVLEQYKTRGFNFLLDVFNSSKVLEEITGIRETYKNIPDFEILTSEDESAE